MSLRRSALRVGLSFLRLQSLLCRPKCITEDMSADALLSAIETESITKDVAMNNRMASVELSLIRKIFCGRSKDIKLSLIHI